MMNKKTKIESFYRWLPIQLFILHFRSNQLLLLFWLVLLTSILNLFATSFGAVSLFLAPRYLGEISGTAFLYIGMALGVFIMSWQITTFIVQSKRIPFLAYSRQVFLNYCINNAIIPLIFTVVYVWKAFRFLRIQEEISVLRSSSYLLLMVLGILLVFLLSFLYFFNLGKDIFRSSFERISNPKFIQQWLPYDKLDVEHDSLQVDSFISKKSWMTPTSKLRTVSNRLLKIILKKHQRNGVFAVFVAMVLLFTIGYFIDYPLFQIPAGAGIFLFFSVLIALLGMFNFFLKTWELLGWIIILSIGFFLIQWRLVDFRSHVETLDYFGKELPAYQYLNIKETFSDSLYYANLNEERQRLYQWFEKRDSVKRPIVFITLSGGGARSMYWSFRALEYADSLSGGELFQQTILISGASGGMIGGSYWRNLHTELRTNKSVKYSPEYQERIGGDLLNPAILGLVTIDLISPFNKINASKWRRKKDRGYVFEHAMVKMTDSVLSGSLSQYVKEENEGSIPILIPYATIINDGRKMIFSSKPMTFLDKSAEELNKNRPIIDAVDFITFFGAENVENFTLNNALRMGASFPFVLPLVHLPSQPKIKVLDGGLRDNYGDEIVMRYIASLEDVLQEIASEVIILKIRDTRDFSPQNKSSHFGLIASVFAPAVSIQQNWNAFQTYKQTYGNHLIHNAYGDNLALKTWTLTYSPKEEQEGAPLNLFLTQKQKEEILLSIGDKTNQEVFQQLAASLKVRYDNTPE